MDDPVFFGSGAEWRAWLEQNHATAPEVWIGFHKRGSGRTGITNAEAVDEALCFGWIDGIVKRIDDHRFRKRFTPRKARSHWSAVNVRRIGELVDQGRVHPAGLRAFEARRDDLTAKASYEQETPAVLGDDYERALRANAGAAAFFDAQPPGYRRTATHWVVRAKKEETRRRRLERLIECSAAGERLPHLIPPGRARSRSR